VGILITDAAKENLHAVLLTTCRTVSGTTLQISQEFNIVFVALGDSEGTQMF